MGFIALLALDSSREEASSGDQAEAQRREKVEHAFAEARVSAKEAVKERLRDPDTAQFRNEVVGANDTGGIVCGEVNAKNGFGGRAGFQRYIWTRNSAAPAGKVFLERDLGERVMTVFWQRDCPT